MLTGTLLLACFSVTGASVWIAIKALDTAREALSIAVVARYGTETLSEQHNALADRVRTLASPPRVREPGRADAA